MPRAPEPKPALDARSNWAGRSPQPDRLNPRVLEARDRARVVDSLGPNADLVRELVGWPFDSTPWGSCWVENARALALLLGLSSCGASVVLDAYALRWAGAAREAAYFATALFFSARSRPSSCSGHRSAPSTSSPCCSWHDAQPRRYGNATRAFTRTMRAHTKFETLLGRGEGRAAAKL